MNIRALIVDDEPLAREWVRSAVAEDPDLEVLGECGDGFEAAESIRRLKPDLVFLDVQMPGLDGFATLRKIPAEQMPVVVFVTAYDHYAVRAFESSAIDYLLKPIDDSRLHQALFRVRQQLRDRDTERNCAQLLNLLGQISGKPALTLDDALDTEAATRLAANGEARLAIRDGGRTVRVEMRSIRWIDAAGDYMCIHTETETHILRATMRELEQQLDPNRFQRVHRSTIVNLDRVRAMRPHINGEYFLTLDCGKELKLSRSYKDKIELLRH